LNQAASGSDEFLDVGNDVIAILDISLHALTEPVLINVGHVGH
jgi:hypothetical protein